jgi:hypothetical protein
MRGVDEKDFWRLIDETRSQNPAEHAEWLVERVAGLGRDEVEAFDRLWQERRVAAYRWDLWAAAYEISGGCSDDCFMDFRNYLISLGRQIYERALQDPDTLADVDISPDEEFEDISYVGQMAYERLGEEPPMHAFSDPPEPGGYKWDEEVGESKKVVPRLAAKYGG